MHYALHQVAHAIDVVGILHAEAKDKETDTTSQNDFFQAERRFKPRDNGSPCLCPHYPNIESFLVQLPLSPVFEACGKDASKSKKSYPANPCKVSFISILNISFEMTFLYLSKPQKDCSRLRVRSPGHFPEVSMFGFVRMRVTPC